MSEHASSPLPIGYRQSIVTAITVFVSFSMALLRFWGLEAQGNWNWRGILVALLIGFGVGLQLVSLFRALDIRDECLNRYKVTLKYFKYGVVVVIAGFFASIFVAV